MHEDLVVQERSDSYESLFSKLLSCTYVEELFAISETIRISFYLFQDTIGEIYMLPEQYLWEMAVQHLEFCRHHENQRQTLSNFTITAAGALLVIIGLDQKVTRLDLLPALLVVIVGLHSMVTVWKHTETSQFHYTRFRVLRNTLDEKLGVSIASLNKIADDEHYSHFPRFRRLSLRQFWFLLNAIIALIGFCLLVVILIST